MLVLRKHGTKKWRLTSGAVLAAAVRIMERKGLSQLTVQELAFISSANIEGKRIGESKQSLASEVRNMPHDADVVMEGKIENYLGNEKYLFNDGFDRITLAISNVVCT
ncbi:hypothetical protein Holit_00737 [Hollandina sp. SP2]